MKRLALTILLWSMLVPSVFAGKTYYISNQGNDGNNGTSPDTPWKTYTKISSVPWEHGDQFLFRCGDTWRILGNKSLQSKGSGTKAKPITIGAYGTCPDYNSYPIFTRTIKTKSGEWSSAGTNLWKKRDSEAKESQAGPNWFFNSRRASWLEDHDGDACPGSMTDDYEVCINKARNTTYVKTPAGAGNPGALNNPGAEYLARPSKAAIEIKDNWINLSRLYVFKTANCISINEPSNLDIVIDDITCNEMGWTNNVIPDDVVGKRGNWAINVEVSETAKGDFTLQNSRIWGCGRDCFDVNKSLPDGNFTIRNNDFQIGYNHGIMFLGKDAYQGNPAQTGSGAKASGTWLVENNTARYFCGGFGFGEGSNQSGGFDNLIFRGNLVQDGITKSAIIGGSVPRYQIKKNGLYEKVPDCSDDVPGFGTFGNAGTLNVTFERNITKNVSKGIQVNGGSKTTANFYNNTFINSYYAGLFLDNLKSSKVYNNVFSDEGSATSGNRQIRCKGACPSNFDVQKNYFSPNNGSNHVVAVFKNRTHYTRTGANGNVQGWKSNNLGNNSGSEPSNLFVNKSSNNWTPGSGSVLIDAGMKNPPILSYRGANPDIGAIDASLAALSPPVLSTARIESATPTQLDLTFATNNTPMLPASGCTGITLSGTSAVPSSCTQFSSLVMHITLNQQPGDNDVITLNYSQSTGNITDTNALEMADLSGFPVVNAIKQNLLTAANVSSLTGIFKVGRELSHSYDGDITDESGSSGGNSNSQFVITHDLGDVFNLGVVRIFGDDDGTWYCSTWNLEYATDCRTWQTWGSNLNCFGNQYWSQDLNGTSAQCLRFTINGNASANATQWYELEAYGQ